MLGQWCQLKTFSDLILNLDLGLILSFPLLIKKKNKNKKVANSLKIVINGSFGKLGSKYSILYSLQLDGVHTMMIHGGSRDKMYPDKVYLRRLASANGYKFGGITNA